VRPYAAAAIFALASVVVRGGADATDRLTLEGALARLTSRQRAVLVLRFYEDLDDREIAEVLRCSPSTIRVHAARGLNRLRTTLSPSVLQKPGASL